MTTVRILAAHARAVFEDIIHSQACSGILYMKIVFVKRQVRASQPLQAMAQPQELSCLFLHHMCT